MQASLGAKQTTPATALGGEVRQRRAQIIVTFISSILQNATYSDI